MKKCIIIANGKSPKKSELNFFIKNGYTDIICADGGANNAYKLKIIPNYIIGDLDSIEIKVLKYFEGKSKIMKDKNQYDTDVEKCLKYAIKKKFTHAVLFGGIGSRLDHSICNLGIIIKFYNKINVSILSGISYLISYKGEKIIQTKKGETISFYGFDKKTKFTSSDLKYPLKNITLPLGKKESTSNVALSECVKIKISGGIGFIIRDFKMVKLNGLF
ncbi:MAG: thiamine diphosphokinase [Ignavibacteriales bacterium CG_4_9_14_3_um_filter_30_11]|nr:MAG: thiamine diphosphokinase [Ignavibacteriales bacterium CG_4_9_14_3_um_filter_30_11]